MITIRRSQERGGGDHGWLKTRHSFSFSDYWDEKWMGFRSLRVINEDFVAPNTGFPTHPHRDMEIVTWVLDGALAHSDSAGHAGSVQPGLAQRMSAGSGIRHSEVNAHQDRPVRFVQMWVAPDADGVEPGYEHSDVSERLADGGLIPVVSGRGHAGAISIRQRDVVLHAARLPSGRSASLPEAPFLHLYVARGQVSLDVGRLDAGDAARVRGSAGQWVTAESRPTGAEILVWEMHAEL